MESRGGKDSSPQNPSRSLHSSLINQGRKFLIAKEEAFCNRHDFFCAYRIGVRTHCVSLTAQIGGRCMLRFLQRDAISVEKEISQILNQTSISNSCRCVGGDGWDQGLVHLGTVVPDKHNRLT